ncbi:MAG: hypothetical protein IK115_09875 [Lachnospiraceae bacterium]|nr:hypothetical protein [Lachnospiraceae bacterium]
MNVSDLSNNLYRQAGVDAANLRRLNVTRRSERTEALGEDRSESPKFSQVLAELAEKHAPEAMKANAPAQEEGAFSLTDSQMRAVLKKALQSDSISSDLVKALTDDDGNVSDSLLDMILGDDDDDSDLESMLGGDSTPSLDKMLTDTKTAQEYLSSTSGRRLIAAMADRSLSGLVS